MCYSCSCIFKKATSLSSERNYPTIPGRWNVSNFWRTPGTRFIDCCFSFPHLFSFFFFLSIILLFYLPPAFFYPKSYYSLFHFLWGLDCFHFVNLIYNKWSSIGIYLKISRYSYISRTLCRKLREFETSIDHVHKLIWSE